MTTKTYWRVLLVVVTLLTLFAVPVRQAFAAPDEAEALVHVVSAGDTLANIKKPDIAMNALNFKTLRSSVEKIKGLPIATVYPGHGKPFPMERFAKPGP